MKNFTCTGCGRKVYFENSFCGACGHALGFDADTLSMVAMATDAGDATLYHRVEVGHAPLGFEGQLRYCANASYGVCNWLTPAAGASRFCPACDLNRTIPNLSEPGSLVAWRELERAKKLLVYSLLRFGLPLELREVGVEKRGAATVRDITAWAYTASLSAAGRSSPFWPPATSWLRPAASWVRARSSPPITWASRRWRRRTARGRACSASPAIPGRTSTPTSPGPRMLISSSPSAAPPSAITTWWRRCWPRAAWRWRSGRSPCARASR